MQGGARRRSQRDAEKSGVPESEKRRKNKSKTLLLYEEQFQDESSIHAQRPNQGIVFPVLPV